MQDLEQLKRIDLARTSYIRAREKRAGGPKSREERSKNREPGTLLGSGLYCVSINAAALLLRIGQREKPLYGRLPKGRLVSVRIVVGDCDPTSLPRWS
jgi:hypothetical protein